MMTFELAIATMHKSKNQIIEMINKMNVKTRCIIINQCDEDYECHEEINGQLVHMVFTKERGLSRSRNMAIRKSKADIIGIADDDLYYYDGFEDNIISFYKSNANIDVAIFNIDSYRKTFLNVQKKCSFMMLGTFISFQITFKRQSVISKNIFFDEYFGTGSKIYDSGEENIFLANCYRKELQIYYSPKKILRNEEAESSWFHGMNEKFLSDRGAIYYAISSSLWGLYVIRFCFKYRREYAPIKIYHAFYLMLKERNNYRRRIG